jgi:hypothetical protein
MTNISYFHLLINRPMKIYMLNLNCLVISKYKLKKIMILTSYSQIKQDLLWKENDVINIIVYT